MRRHGVGVHSAGRVAPASRRAPRDTALPERRVRGHVESKACKVGQCRPSGLIGRGWPKGRLRSSQACFRHRFGEQELPSAQIPGVVSQYLPLEAEGVHLMAKVAVNGEQADPVWSWLTTGPFPGEVGWNFDAVFLLDAAGVPVGRYTATELEQLDGDLSFLVGQS
jgi:hypothetical protein